MADILIDVEVRGSKSVTKAVKDVQTLQNNVKRLSDAMKSGSLSQRQYYKGIDQLAKATGKSSQELRDYATSLRKIEKETKAAKAAQDKEAAAVKAYAQARREATEANRRFDAERRATLAADRQQQQNLERLRMKFVEGYAAMDIYSKELNDLAVARKNDIISAKQQEAAIEQLNKELANGTIIQRRFGGSVNNSTRRIGQGSTMLQQFGYQTGDFIVQVQSGTNAFVAFGQQATQVAGTLTLLQGSIGGISFLALGAGLSVVIPLLTAAAAAFMRTRDSAEDAASGIDAYTESLEGAKEATKSMAFELEALRAGFEDLEEYALDRAVREAEQQVEIIEARIAALQNFVRSPVSGPGGPDPKAIAEQLESERASLEAARAQLELYQNQRDEIEKLKEQARERAEQEERIPEAIRANVLASLEEVDAKQRMIDAQMEYQQSRAAGEKTLHELVQYYADQAIQAIEDSRIEAERVQGVLDAIANSDMPLISKINALANALGIAANEASRLLGNLPSVTSNAPGAGFGPSDPGLVNQTGTTNPLAYTGYTVTPLGTSSRGSSGGGGGVPDFVSKIISSDLQKAIEEAAELTRQYEQEVKLLDTALENGLISQQEYNAYLVDAQEAYNQAADAATNYEDILLKMANTTSDALGDAMMSIVDGTKSASDAFGDMTRIILKKAFELLVINPILNSIFGGVSGFNPLPSLVPGATQANGGVWNNGSQVTAFANGGVVGSPTFFPMANGGVGLMGEAGPEAIMPLKRGKGGRLGVEVSGEQGNVTINQTFAFSANGDDSVKKIIAQEAPKIAALTQKQMLDARRRGGVVRDTFA